MSEVALESDRFFEHVPVMLQETVDVLVHKPDGVYIDATLGGAGHTLEIIKRLSADGVLYGIDQDREAIQAAKEAVGIEPRFHAVQGNFGYIDQLIPLELHGKVDGILFDLGVSTHQIKEPGRGFSFQEEGPLDMRMSADLTITAHSIVNEWNEEDLRQLFFSYGEERLSRLIAREVVAQRPLETTQDLRRVIQEVVKGPQTVKSVARIFQALRIEVNQELERLKMGLSAGAKVLAPVGRLVAISYHSLEDRIVKQFFKSGNHQGVIEKDFYGHALKPFEEVIRGVQLPTDEEIAQNSPSRSAKLRAVSYQPMEG
ncbi:MAG: 16S rRNA (cytosine(1402)-N(4))-methyltransferase RsmH [Rhodothermaeota bacterium MED-G64]|nr:MAG: 16S rRNA (cytosine(1402)-N(4))-methyltransferase RsmH [Rhodothermaeota bacterium MED-G64]|tara:strand:+ start:534 stop:1478 length:945 start_codon:yes stop_codon:yes gene_type:complete